MLWLRSHASIALDRTDETAPMRGSAVGTAVEEDKSFALWEGELRRHARVQTLRSAARAMVEGMILVGGFYCPSLVTAHAANRPASPARATKPVL